ncbi:MAG: 4Fe-4S binding protein [Bacteroidota bacterium]|nr:4Fe-4S binding protein [Bacteroidota bacterium]
MKALFRYFSSIFSAFKSLWTGMRLTFYYLSHPKTILTQQYPENRKTLYIPEAFKGEVVLIHDENNEHGCTACRMCEMTCPNGTIKITSITEETEDGKKKKILDEWIYNLGMCTFCAQCIEACPQNAIKMQNTFEHSVYDRKELIKKLNHPGSKLKSTKKI